MWRHMCLDPRSTGSPHRPTTGLILEQLAQTAAELLHIIWCDADTSTT